MTHLRSSGEGFLSEKRQIFYYETAIEQQKDNIFKIPKYEELFLELSGG